MIVAIPVLLLGAVLLAPGLQQQTNPMDSVFVIEGVGAGKTGAARAGQLPMMGNMTHNQWLDEKVEKALARVDCELDLRINKALAGVVNELKTSKAETNPELEKWAATIVEKAIGRIKAKLKLNLNLERKADASVEQPAVQKQEDPTEPPPEPSADVAPAKPQARAPSAPLGPRPTAVDGKPCVGSMVLGAPKEWCGTKTSGRGSTCTTAYEEDYLKKHGAKLQRGLKALRAPGCFPHGVSVATMGYFRTGSTLLYNVARLWAALGAPGSLVSGFGCKSPGDMGIGVKGKATARCSVVCKDHDFKWGVAKQATVTLMSRRDPWESVCSRRLADLWCRIRQKGRKTQASLEEKAEYQKECLRNDTVQAWEAQNQCKDLMLMQANIYHERRIKGGTIAYDVLLSDYQHAAALQVRTVAEAMGICPEAYRDPALVEFVVSAGTFLHDKPGQDMGITQMHDVHTDAQRNAKCSKLREWMRQDSDCREWMDGDASADANAILRRMDAELPEKKQQR